MSEGLSTPRGRGGTWPSSGEVRTGTVRCFDDERGLGVVADDGGEEFAFHCTAIADGTRSIAPGTRVAFAVAAGHLGRREGRGLSTLP